MSDLKNISNGIIINIVNTNSPLVTNKLLEMYPRVLSTIERIIDMYDRHNLDKSFGQYSLENRSMAEWAIPQKLLVYNCFVDNDDNIPTAIYKLKQCEPSFKNLMATEQYNVYAFMKPKESIEIIWPGIMFIGDYDET